MKRRLLLFGVLAIAFATPVRSEAGFVDDFVGNSGFTTGGDIGGWVNFAVYTNPAGSNWLTDLGVSLDSVTGTSATGNERNVFFYQAVRNSTGSAVDGELTALNIPKGRDSWTGIGVLDDVVFQDSSGEDVTATGGAGTRRTIGTAAAAGSTDTSGTLDTTPLSDAFVSNTDGVVPSLVSFLGDGTGRFLFPFTFDASEHSPVLFLTSHSNPLILTFSTATPGTLSGSAPNVDFPVSNPEPGSLVLLGLGMMGGGAGVLWKRRKKKTAPESV